MPTGYTAAVKDGISFEQFVWSCARAMGALIMMRDEPSNAPIPDRFEPSDYNAKEVVKLLAQVDSLQAMSLDSVHAAADAAHAQALQRHRERIHERLELRNKYSEMLSKVVQWKAPTHEHEGFKEFMASQLRESIEFDCSDKYDDAPVKQDATAWHSAQITEARRQIAYHEREQADENERTEQRNAWLAALRASVPPPAA